MDDLKFHMSTILTAKSCVSNGLRAYSFCVHLRLTVRHKVKTVRVVKMVVVPCSSKTASSISLFVSPKYPPLQPRRQYFFSSGVRLLVLRPLTGLLYQPLMIGEGDCREIGGLKIGRGNRSTRRKPAPAPLLSTTNPT
jgi:hypothetical protein